MSDLNPTNKSLKAKGNFLFELLAVILAVALFFSLTYPARLWKAEEHNTKECRENMQHIFYAEITYLDDMLQYNDTLEVVVDYILSDTTQQRLRKFTGLDSLLATDIINYFDKIEDQMVDITQDSIFGEGPDSTITKMVDITVSALVDSMQRFAKRTDMDTTNLFILDSLRHWPEFDQKIDSVALYTLNNMFRCPTTNEGYLIEAFNDSTPKVINIYCPIDSSDIDSVDQDFKVSTLGGLRIENHGNIEGGEKSW